MLPLALGQALLDHDSAEFIQERDYRHEFVIERLNLALRPRVADSLGHVGERQLGRPSLAALWASRRGTLTLANVPAPTVISHEYAPRMALHGAVDDVRSGIRLESSRSTGPP